MCGRHVRSYVLAADPAGPAGVRRCAAARARVCVASARPHCTPFALAQCQAAPEEDRERAPQMPEHHPISGACPGGCGCVCPVPGLSPGRDNPHAPPPPPARLSLSLCAVRSLDTDLRMRPPCGWIPLFATRPLSRSCVATLPLPCLWQRTLFCGTAPPMPRDLPPRTGSVRRKQDLQSVPRMMTSAASSPRGNCCDWGTQRVSVGIGTMIGGRRSGSVVPPPLPRPREHEGIWWRVRLLQGAVPAVIVVACRFAMIFTPWRLRGRTSIERSWCCLRN